VYAQTGNTGCVNKYMVVDGDTLSGIARRFRVDMNELAAVNKIQNVRLIKIGDILCLDGLVVAQPQPGTGTGAGTGGPITPPPVSPPLVGGGAMTVTVGGRTYATDAQGYYTVQPGDNLYRITLAFGASMTLTAQINNLASTNFVYVGQRLLIPPATPSQPVPGLIPAISLQPRLAGPGETITVMGYNYRPGATINLYLEKPSLRRQSNVLKTVTADANGRFTTTVVIPATWPDGFAVDTRTVSIAGRTPDGLYWGMNFFINRAFK
jgi:LysM repeat protein